MYKIRSKIVKKIYSLIFDKNVIDKKIKKRLDTP